MDILDKFIQTAKETVQSGYYQIQETPAEKVSLKNKLLSQDFSIITEIKHASPSGEYSYKEIDAEKTAHLFRESGADAISCVVEPKFFKGNLSNIPLAKKSGLPILFKDFIFCEEQIKSAKAAGADAILLIVKLAQRLNLNLDNLIETAHKNGLEVLLECYDADELKTALKTKADILGINNRDLQTLNVDIKRTETLLKSIKLDRPLISESGIKTAQDIEFVKNAGASAALVGTAIWTSSSIAEKIRELKSSSRSTYYGEYGGQFVSELIMPAIQELEQVYLKQSKDLSFQKELAYYLKHYAGRPSSLYFAKNLSKEVGCKVYLKREDLNHTGAHKINNVLGQGLLAKKMGKTRLIAETGAGQHGVATATVAAFFGLECDIFMGVKDIERQKMNVYRMELLGARVIPCKSGSQTLKDAINEALRNYAATFETTHYLIGTVVGPHPYPMIVRDFQSVIGQETKEQILELENRLPTHLYACAGGGSNAMGLFYPFEQDTVKMIACEPGGKGLETGEHGAAICAGEDGVLHGMKSKFLQEGEGFIKEAYSIAAGLDYPGLGPQLADYAKSGQVRFEAITDSEAVSAFKKLSQLEGIIPALESAHAVAQVLKDNFEKDDLIVICLSGRGDKDLDIIRGFK